MDYTQEVERYPNETSTLGWRTLASGKCFVGYDVGTSGVKAVLIDSRGHLISSCFQAYPSYSPIPGAHEQEPRDWWKSVATATRQIMKNSQASSTQVAGISCGVQGLGFIPVDAHNEPLNRCMTWLDSRSIKEVSKISEETGYRLSAKDVPAKCLWLRKHKPRVFQRAYKFVDCGAYLLSKLTGNFAWPIENALWFGYDEKKKEWPFERYGLSQDRVPTPIAATGVVGMTTVSAGKDLKLHEGIPVIAGGSDVTAAVTGSGALKSGSAHVYLGSSSWFCITSSKRTPTGDTDIPSGGLFAINPFGRWFFAGESESACSCLDWLADQLRPAKGNVYPELDRLAAKAEPGSGNLIFLPWMKGERAPIQDDSARGAFMGITLNHGREHLVRSVMEGVAFNIQWVRDRMKSQHLDFERQFLRAIGGGFNSRIWTQILADIMNKEIHVVRWPQYAGAIGAALIATLGTGVYGDLDDLDGLLPVWYKTRPRKRFLITYDRLLKNFKEAYPTEIARIYHEWDSIQDIATESK